MDNPSSSSPKSVPKSYLHLSDPIYLQGEWKYSWFDIARQQMLLFKDSTFFLWSPCQIDPGPVVYFYDSSWPQQMLLAKISIDSQLLAIQYSKTSIYVVDVIGRRKWTVEIKYMSGNEILPNGIIWSEHGGNSQDLVIVTSRGLELYKVSTARGQCKLSRNINLKTHFFWYEPNFRAILVAVTTRDYTLEVTGFFLRYDMSDMPRLELPAPDRLPTFSLGAGAGPQDVKVVTLYGKLYCAVRYAEPEGDILSLYHLNKTKAERVYNFPLHMSSDVMISVTDNLLCCHCLHYNVTLLLDLKILSVSPGNKSDTDFLCGACTMTVDESQLKIPTMNGKPFTPSSSPPLNDNSAMEQILPTSFPRSHSLGPPQQEEEEWSDAVGVGGELGLESLNLVSPLTDGLSNGNLNTGSYTRSRHNSISSTSGQINLPSTPRKGLFLSPEFSNQSDSYGNPQEILKKEGSPLQDFASSPPQGGGGSSGPTSLLSPVREPPSSEKIRHSSEPYAGDWLLIFPYWVWNPQTNCLLKIKCNLSALGMSFHDPRRVVNFLALRGNPVLAPRPTFFADYEDSFEAKKNLLTRLLISLEDQNLSTQWITTFLDEIIHHYANEYHRRNLISQQRRDRYESSNINLNSSKGYDDEAIANETIRSDASSGSPNGGKDEAGSSISGGNSVGGMTMARTRRRIFTSTKTDDSDTCGVDGVISQQTQSLYLQSSTSGRKVSVNTQTITMMHLARLKEQQELMKSSSSSTISTTSASITESSAPSLLSTSLAQLEPTLDVHLFFPEIFTIGFSSFQSKTKKESVSSLSLSAPPPLSVIRNDETYLICTQTEIFSFVLLPYALRLISSEYLQQHGQQYQSENIQKLINHLYLIIASLRAVNVPANVSLSLLVIHLLCHQYKYLEIAHTIQLQFLSDSSELALAVLDISDCIEDEYILHGLVPNRPLYLSSSSSDQSAQRYHSSSENIIQLRELKQSLSAIRQAGLDLLWRIQDKTTVVRWLLTHGRVIDAMNLCTKVRGQWRNGLTPVSIPGLDFFRSGMSELCTARQTGQLNSTTFIPLKYLGKNSLSWKRSQSDLNLLRHYYQPPTSEGEIESIHFEAFTTEQQGVHLLHTVYKFLNVWDSSLLTIQKVLFFFPLRISHFLSFSPLFKINGKSRLASMAHFPDDIFSESITIELKLLFGFL